MLTINRPDIADLHFVVGYRLTCSSCIRTVFVESNNSITDKLAAAGWQEVITSDSHFPCVCPKCIQELREIEAESAQGVTHE